MHVLSDIYLVLDHHDTRIQMQEGLIKASWYHNGDW